MGIPFRCLDKHDRDFEGIVELTYECGCLLWFHVNDPDDLDWREQCTLHTESDHGNR